MKKDNRPNRKSEEGLTLLELLIVIVILGLLGVLASLQVIKYLGKSKIKAANLQIEQISTAINLFQIDVGRIPTSEEGLNSLIEKPSDLKNWDGPYLTKEAAIIDPWQRPFNYVSPSDKHPFNIYTLGADGKEGGESENQDQYLHR